MKAMIAIGTLLLASGLFIGILPAEAQLTPYDNFSGKRINSSKWWGWNSYSSLEITRQIKRGKLLMSLRNNPWTSGQQALNFNKAGADVNNLTTIQATVTVKSFDSATASPDVGLVGNWYNSGGATPGSQTNDVLSGLKIVAWPGTTTLNVTFWAWKCTSPDCATGEGHPGGGTLATNVKQGVAHSLTISFNRVCPTYPTEA